MTRLRSTAGSGIVPPPGAGIDAPKTCVNTLYGSVAGMTGSPAARQDNRPVLFTNTSPTYANLTPVASSSSGGGGGMSTAGIVAIVAVGLAGAALIVYFVRRRRTAEERE